MLIKLGTRNWTSEEWVEEMNKEASMNGEMGRVFVQFKGKGREVNNCIGKKAISFI